MTAGNLLSAFTPPLFAGNLTLFGVIMTKRDLGFGTLAAGLILLVMVSACASLQTPGNATTQALGDVSAVTGAVAPVVAATAPPWGQIVAGVLGAISVIAGIVVHSSASNTSAQQVVNAVTTGLQAAAGALPAGSASTSSAAAP